MKAILFVVVSASLSSAFAAESAKDIVDAADKRHQVPFEHTHSRMTLQEKDGPARERTLESWASHDEKLGDKLRLKFQTPADVQGTGMLTLDAKGADEAEQWLYLPAFKKTRRIAQAELGDRFVGSDLFYEDMKRRKIDDYQYTLLPDEKVEGQDCWVIEAVPTAPTVVKQSPYGKSTLWVRKDNSFVVRTRLFDKKLKPLKQIDSTQLKKLGGTAWRADQTTVVDVVRKHRTVLTVVDRDTKAQGDDTFSKRLLEAE